MNILFIIVFIVIHEVFATIGGIVMAVLPNWVVITMCEVFIGLGASVLTKKIFSKHKISNLALYICVLSVVAGAILNIYNTGFSFSLLWYNLIGCITVFCGFFEFD